MPTAAAPDVTPGLTRATPGIPRAAAVRRPGSLDASSFLAGIAVFCLVLFVSAILGDGDTLWQIATGNWILDHHAIPTTDPFSFTAGSRRWFAHEWLAEVLMALAHRAAGMAGVMALAAAAAGVAAGILLHVLRRFLAGPNAFTLWIVAAAAASVSLLARPHLLTWPCLVLWCGALVLARARRGVPPASVLPVMTVWANMHGSFMLGLLLPGALALEALLDRGANRRRVVREWTLFTAAAWAAALLNPELIDGLLFPFRQLGMASLASISEWQPTRFSGVIPLELILMILLALGLSGRLTLPPVRLLLMLVLIHRALAHVRDNQLIGLVGALLIAGPLAQSLGRPPAEPSAPSRTRRRVALLGAACVPVALAVRMLLPLPPDRTGAAVAAALDDVPATLRAQPVLNGYGLGCDLIFAGIRPFVDSRADLYGDAFLARYGRIVGTDAGALQQAIAEYGIAWTVFPDDHPILRVLDGLPGWHRLVQRAGIVVHARGNRPE